MENNKNSIIIGSDHAAYNLKKIIVSYLEEKNISVIDIGTDSLESTNYVIYGQKVAKAISSNDFTKGILLCGTGLGMSIVANRFKGVRATLCNDIFSAKMGRKHNDSNILVLAGRVVGDMLAKEIVDTWLKTEFDGGRHQERLNTIDL